jgi:hypothetical protein
MISWLYVFGVSFCHRWTLKNKGFSLILFGGTFGDIQKYLCPILVFICVNL